MSGAVTKRSQTLDNVHVSKVGRISFGISRTLDVFGIAITSACFNTIGTHACYIVVLLKME